MISDYSEVTATLNREVTELINLLNDKKWLEARNKACKIDAQMYELIKWICKEEFGLDRRIKNDAC